MKMMSSKFIIVVILLTFISIFLIGCESNNNLKKDTTKNKVETTESEINLPNAEIKEANEDIYINLIPIPEIDKDEHGNVILEDNVNNFLIYDINDNNIGFKFKKLENVEILEKSQDSFIYHILDEDLYFKVSLLDGERKEKIEKMKSDAEKVDNVFYESYFTYSENFTLEDKIYNITINRNDFNGESDSEIYEFKTSALVDYYFNTIKIEFVPFYNINTEDVLSNIESLEPTKYTEKQLDILQYESNFNEYIKEILKCITYEK